MKNMKVAKKLILGFSIVAFFSLIVGCVGVYGLITINKNEDILYREGVESLTGINGMYSVIVEQRLELRGIIINIDDAQVVRNTIAALRAREQEFEELYQLYQSASSGADDSETALVEVAMKAYNGQFATLKQQMLAALEADDKEAVRRAFEQTASVSEEATEALYGVVLSVNERVAELNERDGRMACMLIIASIVLTVVLVIISILLGLYIAGLISRPLITISSFLNQARESGDISLRPEDKSNIEKLSRVKDEIGILSNSLSHFLSRIHDVNAELERIAAGDLSREFALLSDRDSMGLSLKKMQESLNTMFREIEQSSDQVSTGSKQIAEGAQSLALGATEQAAAIEQLSSSIDEITGKTKQNAQTARQAAMLSDSIKGNAEKGSAQMNQMMQAVKDINESSSQINKVIKVIDDIAFQTNILALNAAVEAARAGQHGKGFAVVAEEVRNLAAKSAEAAKDSGGLIEDSIEKATLGLDIANRTADALREIVGGINQSTEIVEQIAHLSDEQAGAIEQINVGIEQVAQVVQQNSATAEQSAAAAEQMSGQSDMLAQLIAQFKLKEGKDRMSAGDFAAPHKNVFSMQGKPVVFDDEANVKYGKY